MSKNGNKSSFFLWIAFIPLLIGILVATLYPFNFCPPNGVEWLSNKPGIYFNGHGIAYTDRDKSFYETKAITLELLLKERLGSKNWGPRGIFSFFDGSAKPSLFVGQWGGRIFVYSRYEKNEGNHWYRLFSTQIRFPRGKPQLVTVTWGEGEKAIYIDGELVNKRSTDILETANVKFSGRLILGNLPTGKNGWWGEVKCIAIFNRILLPNEIKAHRKEILENGMHGLIETPGCVALYPFKEGKGDIAESIIGESRRFYIPESRTSLAATIFEMPHRDMRRISFVEPDFLMNIIFFFPFGVLLSAIILRKYNMGYFITFLVSTIAGSLLSLSIEFLQLLLPTRTAGIADVISNAIGSGLGGLVAYLIEMKRQKRVWL